MDENLRNAGRIVGNMVKIRRNIEGIRRKIGEILRNIVGNLDKLVGFDRIFWRKTNNMRGFGRRM